MARITTYDALVTFARGLKPGDDLTVGADAVSPALISAFTDLSLAGTFTVDTSVVADEPPSVVVTCTAEFFGLTSLATSLAFTPEGVATGPFLLAIRTAPAAGTEWNLVNGFTLSGPAITIVHADEVDVLAVSVSSNVVIGTGRSLTLPITVTIPTYPDQNWVLAGEFSAQPLSADAFSALAGGMKLSDYLPSPLDTLARFGLTELEVAYSPARGALSYVFMEIAYPDPWKALGGVIDVPAGGVTLSFRVSFDETSQSYIELGATLEIATVPVDLGAHFAPNNFFVWGKLRDGRTVALNDVFAHFAVTMPEGFPAIEIDRLSVMANLSQGQYQFDLVAKVDAGTTLKVDDLTAHVSVSTTPEKRVDADFHATIRLGDGTSLFLQAQYDGGGGGLTLIGSAREIPIGRIFAYFLAEFGINEAQLPEPIRTLTLERVDTKYNTATGDFTFDLVGKFTLYDEAVAVTFSVSMIHPASPRALTLPADAVTGTKGYSATFGGSISFADRVFGVVFNTTDTGQRILVADYQHTGGGGEVRIHDLVASVSRKLAAPIPESISINLKVVKFAWMKAVPAGGGDATNHFLFGIELGAEIGLSNLPLIGQRLPPDLTVAFSDLQFAYAKPGFDKDQAGKVNALLPKGIGKIPADGLTEGVLIASTLQLGDATHDLELRIPTGGESHALRRLPTPALRGSVVAPAAGPAVARDRIGLAGGAGTPSVAMSINVQRQFGPLAIRKLGMAYEDERLFVTGDISLNADVLSIGLLGLGIGSKISAFDPAVKLSGLSITIETGTVSVSGGLYGSIDPLNFNGALQVTVPSLTLGALGGYAKVGQDPSFFMYVAVNRPLFGYPFFFLNGVAGGLGFNRDLMIPEIERVADFPLVAWSTGKRPPRADPNGDIGKQVQDVVAALATEIPPRVGQYWVAAGVSFSSFNILQSFALVTVVFGTDFKLALLGVTTASLPPNTGTSIEPLGFVEMALRASFSPQTGILEIEARLTAASYILSKTCRLTGGFAFYMWFKDNPKGDPKSYSTGDFVVTLGGYNPAYRAPSYFPSVPRLGFNWKVDSRTTIKGGIYFAITPSAMMAGGALEAVWQSGDLKAWFTAHADFLLSWKPFHYETVIGLTIGASYKLNLLFTSKTISVHIGVELALWGPPFGGRIYVDLTVISFTVRIGNTTKPKVTPISWTDFKASFLPDPTARHASALVAGAAVPTDSYCLSSIAAGLVKDLSGAKQPVGIDWVVRAEGLEVVTMTVLPTKTATLTTAGDRTTPLPVGKTDFGVGPVGVSIADFASSHAVAVNRIVGGVPDPSFDITQHATIDLASSNLPSATWGGKLVVNPSISQVNNTPASIADLTVGYRIKAKPGVPDHTPLPIDVSILQQESEGVVGFDWLTPTIPTTDDYDQLRAMRTFQTTLTTATAKRAAIIAALNGAGLRLGVDPNVDVRELARSADTVLLDPPVLSHLGEERAKEAR